MKYDKYFLKFANDLSKNYKSLKDGDVFVNDSNTMLKGKGKEYKVIIRETLMDNDRCVLTPARVGVSSGIIELQLSVMREKEFSQEIIYFWLLWCQAMVQYKHNDIYRADMMALRQYLKENRSRKKLLIGICNSFMHTDTQMNRDRYEIIEGIAKAYESGGVKKIIMGLRSWSKISRTKILKKDTYAGDNVE